MDTVFFKWDQREQSLVRTSPMKGAGGTVTGVPITLENQDDLEEWLRGEGYGLPYSFEGMFECRYSAKLDIFLLFVPMTGYTFVISAAGLLCLKTLIEFLADFLQVMGEMKPANRVLSEAKDVAQFAFDTRRRR